MSKVTLGDVAIERRETLKVTKADYPTVGLEHLIPKQITLTTWGKGSDTTFTKVFHKGQVLFGRRRAYLKKAAVAPFDGLCSGDITVIEAKADLILPELLPFIIQNDAFFDYAVGKSAGSLSPRVKWEHLKKYEFELPDMAEQRKLSKLLWSMVEAKDAYQELLRQTDELVKARFIEMFGEPLTQTITGKGIPVRRLGDIITLGPQNGLYKPQKFYKADGSGTPIVRVDSFYDGHVFDFPSLKRLQCTQEEQELYCLQNGDFVFNRVNGSVEQVGKCALIQEVQETTVFESNVMRIRVNENMVNIYYLAAYLCSDIIRAQIKGTAKIANQASINQEDIKNLLVPLPTITHQNEYAVFVHQSDKSKLELGQAIRSLGAIYKRILSENLG